MSAHYDDPKYSYVNYWQGRDYEHQSELLAITALLKNNTKYRQATDLGGGFGRLTPVLSKVSRKASLVEPSAKLRRQAHKYLSDFKNIAILAGTAQKTHLPNSSQDLVMMIRVIHHLPDPGPALKEIHRILRPGGALILEFANSYNFKSRIHSILTGQPILLTPIERRSLANIRRRTIPFVNHHPKTIHKLLTRSGFTVRDTLSVSNFRSPTLKKTFPHILDYEDGTIWTKASFTPLFRS